jgi:2-C-methyl-D-erythritol 4-phosphate cytidylyltransferase/2-C-methyl-D-erythritol 2,4-cyclodiphosphate synthase
VWGIRSAAGAAPPGLDGVVVAPAGGSRLERLLAGLRQVPEDAEIVVFVDDATPAGDLAALRAGLTDGVAAAVRGTPVTDALKRVDGDRIVAGVDRTDLLTLAPPYVLRRAAVTQALGAPPDPRCQDPVDLLLAAGHRVRVLPP